MTATMIDLKLAPTPAVEVLRRGPMRVMRYVSVGGAPEQARAGLADPTTSGHADDSSSREAGERLRRTHHTDVPRLPVPVVLVPSIINRAYVFDLRAGQSLVQALLAAGLDVFLVDWGTPAQADARLGLGDYALRLLGRAVDAACRAAGARQAHLLGYCLGGTFSLIHAARRPAKVASVIALTTPVDLTDPGAMLRLTDPRLVDLEALARAFPVVPGLALWAAFQSLDPAGNSRKARHVAGEEDEEKRARLLAQERWLSDPVPMTARALQDIVGRLYRDNALPSGRLELEGAPVDLRAGTAPVLNLIATGDTVVPPASSRALEALWGGPVETVEVKAGHIGITVGSQAPRHMWKTSSEWLCARQGQESVA